MFFMEGLSGVQFQLYGDVPKKKDPVNGLLVANHQSTSDWIIVDSFAMRLGNAGYLHFFAKDALKYVPLFGLYWHQHGLIFVKRGNNNLDFIRKQLQDKRKNNIPMLMTLFPEGTRFNPENERVLAKSRSYAQSIGFPECTKILTPRVTGANIFVEELGDHLKKIFDITIAYEHLNGDMIRPDTTEFLDKVRTVHIHISQKPITDAQNNEGWLYESFKKKEAMLIQFDETRTFPEPASDSGHIFSSSVFSETLVPVLYTGLLCSPLLWSKTARKLWIQTCLIVPVLQILAKPIWR